MPLQKVCAFLKCHTGTAKRNKTRLNRCSRVPIHFGTAALLLKSFHLCLHCYALAEAVPWREGRVKTRYYLSFSFFFLHFVSWRKPCLVTSDRRIAVGPLLSTKIGLGGDPLLKNISYVCGWPTSLGYQVPTSKTL